MPKVKIIEGANPYELDRVETSNGVVALTRKNADFIEAVVRLDSNYGDDLIIKEPSKGYDPESNAQKSSKKNRGSTAYWFGEMQKPNCDFSRCVLGAIISIDITNSTHLEAAYFLDQSGNKVPCRKRMRDIICSQCSNCQELVDLLNQLFEPKNHNHLISLLTAKTVSKKGGKPRYNISFATKFCAYASLFLKANNKYSKYDNIVSDALPKYEEIYLGRKKRTKEYKIEHNKLKNKSDAENYQYRLDVYANYAKTIDDILEFLNTTGVSLTKEEFDHIVWYSFK